MRCFFCNQEMNDLSILLRDRCNHCGKDFYDLSKAVEGMVSELEDYAKILESIGSAGEYLTSERVIFAAGDIRKILEEYKKGDD